MLAQELRREHEEVVEAEFSRSVPIFLEVARRALQHPHDDWVAVLAPLGEGVGEGALYQRREVIAHSLDGRLSFFGVAPPLLGDATSGRTDPFRNAKERRAVIPIVNTLLVVQLANELHQIIPPFRRFVCRHQLARFVH